MTVAPVNSFYSFSQPAARYNLSMHKAKRDILDQRKNLMRFKMHGKLTVSGAELAA